MASTFKPRPAPRDPKELAAHVDDQFREVERAENTGRDALYLTVLYAVPSKLTAGMIVYADGTTWNPGSGEGVYRRNKANSAWVHLG